jgi:hypothetical protein
MKTQSLELEPILQRLEKLESQNRRLKRTPILLLLLLGSLALMGASRKGHPVKASEFILQDADGNTRASLKMGNTGPYLVFYGADGKVARALVGVLPAGPALGFYDAKGKTRVSLALSSNSANLTFDDSDEKLRAEIGVLQEGPNLLFLDADGKPVYKAR